MADTNFLKMTCRTNVYKMCKQCKRDFVLSVGEIATIMKNGNDKAVIQTTDEYFHPFCGNRARTIQTDIGYDDFIRQTDIKPKNLGDVMLKVSRPFYDTEEAV